jgi:glycine cleavage system H lipoate-binding protein
MRCPFIREAQVKYCRASAFRKMIVRMPGQLNDERCSSPEYARCPAAKQHNEDHPSLDHCPFLHESLVQYCAAASVTKYIPYSEAVLSNCGTESHKYCELFLAIASPEHPSFHETEIDTAICNDYTKAHMVDGVSVPGWLSYSPNHMWMNVSDDGVVHIGVDAFLAKTLGSLDRLSFITTKGVARPTVVLTVCGVDLQMVFPNPIHISKANAYLRTNPSKVLTDPYTIGWLFEGTEVKDSSSKKDSPSREGLVTGKAAVSWMQNETSRMSEVVHVLSQSEDHHGNVLMTDGGGTQQGFVRHLHRDETLNLFNDFFSPLATWRKQK